MAASTPLRLPGVDARPVLDLGVGPGVARDDDLAVEEPLQVRLRGEPLAVLMRTPGDDLALAAGFALTEQVVGGPHELRGVRRNPRPGGGDDPNDVDLDAEPGRRQALDQARRAIFASTACGLCGKSTIAAVRLVAEPFRAPLDLPGGWLRTLPALLRDAQEAFQRTGGLHAAALVTLGSERPVLVREDVGRHNACDKVVGAARLPRSAWPTGEEPREPGLPLDPGVLARSVLVVSGRASFEVVQKAWVAGIGAVAALSAPSSMAVDLAVQARLTLVAFLSAARANVYSGTVDGAGPGGWRPGGPGRAA